MGMSEPLHGVVVIILLTFQLGTLTANPVFVHIDHVFV